MEVKAGYKRTEVGVIPDDWDLITLGQIFGFKNGLNKAKEFFGYGTPIINYMDVFRKAGLLNSDVLGRVCVNRNELKAYEVRKGDVFFTRTSETVEEIGIAAAMVEEPKDAVFSGFVLRARPTDDSLDNEFKKYCFSARYFRQQVISRASYTTRALTNGRSLSAALLARPPVPEQRAIATALSDADALIASLEMLIAKKCDLRRAAIQQLLSGKIRLAGFAGEWETRRLGDVLRFQVGFPFPSGGFNENGTGVRIIRNRDLKDQNTGELYFGRAFDDAYVVRNGDVLVGMDGDFLVCLWSGGHALLNQRVGRIVCGKQLDSRFMYFRLAEPLKEIEAATSSTTVKHLSHRDVEKLTLALPGLEEQSAIATILSDIDDELAALEIRQIKAQALKQGMMQALLTGRIRLA